MDNGIGAIIENMVTV